jgi:hypothetical protein
MTDTQCTKGTQNAPIGHKISQISVMAIKYINIFPSEALKIVPKLGFLVLKETIWQPWCI